MSESNDIDRINWEIPVSDFHEKDVRGCIGIATTKDEMVFAAAKVSYEPGPKGRRQTTTVFAVTHTRQGPELEFASSAIIGLRQIRNLCRIVSIIATAPLGFALKAEFAPYSSAPFYVLQGDALRIAKRDAVVKVAKSQANGSLLNHSNFIEQEAKYDWSRPNKPIFSRLRQPRNATYERSANARDLALYCVLPEVMEWQRKYNDGDM